MLIKNLELIQLSKNLESIMLQKVPFSLTITKNTKNVSSLLGIYNDDRNEIINKYCVLNEDGSLLGKIGEDGKRIENPQTLQDIETDDMESLLKELNELDSLEIDVELFEIDLNKVYYDSRLDDKSTIGDYIESNIDPHLVAYLSNYGIIKI